MSNFLYSIYNTVMFMKPQDYINQYGDINPAKVVKHLPDYAWNDLKNLTGSIETDGNTSISFKTTHPSFKTKHVRVEINQSKIYKGWAVQLGLSPIKTWFGIAVTTVLWLLLINNLSSIVRSRVNTSQHIPKVIKKISSYIIY